MSAVRCPTCSQVLAYEYMPHKWLPVLADRWGWLQGDIVKVLVRSPLHWVSHDAMVERIYANRDEPKDPHNCIAVAVNDVRDKLRPVKWSIECNRHAGYRLVPLGVSHEQSTA